MMEEIESESGGGGGGGRQSAIHTTEWTKEEYELLARWEKMADLKKRAHHEAARKFQKRSECLTTAVSIIGSIVGSSGVTSYFTTGLEDPALLVVGIIVLLGGVATAVAKGFNWEEKQTWNAISTTDFADIARDVRTYGSMANLTRRDVELYLMGLKSSIKTAESREPWVPFTGIDDEQLLNSPSRSRSRHPDVEEGGGGGEKKKRRILKREPSITHPCPSCLMDTTMQPIPPAATFIAPPTLQPPPAYQEEDVYGSPMPTDDDEETA